MSCRNERFYRRFVSLDEMCEGRDVSKWAMFSDGGAGARAVREGELRSTNDELRMEEGNFLSDAASRRVYGAERRLRGAGLGHLIPVLRLIVKNGNDFHESIEKLARKCKNLNASRKKYFEHRSQLLRFFGVKK